MALTSESASHAVAGAVGGMVSLAATYPLLTLCTRFQVAASDADSSWLQEFLKVIDKEGWSALYSGIAPSMVGVCVGQFVYYFCYAFLQQRLLPRSPSASASFDLMTNIVIPSLAGSASATCSLPIWVVTTQMQATKKTKHAPASPPADTDKQSDGDIVQSLEAPATHPEASSMRTMMAISTAFISIEQMKEARSLLHHDNSTNILQSSLQSSSQSASNSSASNSSTSNSSSNPSTLQSTLSTCSLLGSSELVSTILRIYRASGLRGFWSGLLPSLVLVSNPVIQYACYEKMKHSLLIGRAAGASLSGWEVFWLGALSKTITTIFTYPIQVIKSRIQMVAHHNNPPASFVKVIYNALKADGALSFYQGLSSKILQTVINSALMFYLQAKLQRLVLRVFLRMLRQQRPANI